MPCNIPTMPRAKSKKSELKHRINRAREAARHLIEECYEEELLRGLSGCRVVPGAMADEPVRAAILGILRNRIDHKPASERDLLVILKALNEPARMLPRDKEPQRYMPLVIESANRTAAQMLIECMWSWGSWGSPGEAPIEPPLLVCKNCGKVAIKVGRHKRFCSTQCRWEFWNKEKMEGYYRNKAKEARDHLKHLRELRAKRLSLESGPFPFGPKTQRSKR